MPKIRRSFQCDWCGIEYETIKECRDCEARGFHPTLKVGDIVLGNPGYGWYDGDRRWVVNPDVRNRPKKHADGRNCFGVCCNYVFYYVVTKIDGHEDNAHRPRYHLITNAMTGKEGHRGGWTYDIDHIKVSKTQPSESVLDDSKRLLGEEAKCLLM